MDTAFSGFDDRHHSGEVATRPIRPSSGALAVFSIPIINGYWGPALRVESRP